jgi:coproporphyrinogen III oxidase-like Fe-S oxidoreductase
MYLWQGNKDTLYRIHGTVEPWTIGTSVSSGCIRPNSPKNSSALPRCDIDLRQMEAERKCFSQHRVRHDGLVNWSKKTRKRSREREWSRFPLKYCPGASAHLRIEENEAPHATRFSNARRKENLKIARSH